MEQKGVIASLFDFSFSHFITPKITKILYALLLAASGVAGIGVFLAILNLGSGFFGKVGGALGGLICGPLVFLFLAMYSRVAMEIVIVLFRSVEYLREISESAKKQA